MKPYGYSSAIIALFLFLRVLPTYAQEKDEKSVIKIDLAYHQQNDDLPILKANAKTKKGKKFEAVEGVNINLYFKEESTQGFIGSVKTNNKGIGNLTLPERFKNDWMPLPSSTFVATVTGNRQYDDVLTEIEISKAKIELNLEEKDSVRTIYAKVLAFQDSSWIEVPESEIKLVVRRLLSDIKIGEEDSYMTDEKGEVSAEFDLSIPGDHDGNIFIGAKIEENELYGTLITTKMIKWGTPMEVDNSFENRTLWATRDKTPIWLLIFPNLIIAGVWGIIFYLVYQITRIIKLGKAKESV